MKRPDVSLRNRVNNPMGNPESRRKMIDSLTGRKQGEETKRKRSEAMKRYYADKPSRVKKHIGKLHKEYTDKIRGTGWRKIRLKVLDRDNHTCQMCSESKKLLYVHHIDGNGKNMTSHKLMNNELDNLITMCPSCHNDYHKSAKRKV